MALSPDPWPRADRLPNRPLREPLTCFEGKPLLSVAGDWPRVTTFGVSTWRLTVDGQTFSVAARPGSPGTYDFDWLSGPNPGYGFTSQRTDHQEMSSRELTHVVRTFLAQIDPDTGYIP